MHNGKKGIAYPMDYVPEPFTQQFESNASQAEGITGQRKMHGVDSDQEVYVSSTTETHQQRGDMG